MLEQLNIDIIDVVVLGIGFLTGGTFLLPPKMAKYLNIIGKAGLFVGSTLDKLEKTKGGLSNKKHLTPKEEIVEKISELDQLETQDVKDIITEVAKTKATDAIAHKLASFAKTL